MSPEKWREISRIFHLALGVKADERGAFLDEKCGADVELRRELENLLSASASADSFIDSPKAALTGFEKQPKLKSGERLGGFGIRKMLGAGGMGEVYLAKDLRLNRLVALKILPSDSAIDINANRRFVREAQAAAALEHPNICTTHEIGEQDGLSFIVMQYVEGETLSTLIKSGGLRAADALDIALQVAAALSAAHGRGIVHRDIKPANIIVSPNNQVKVLDFGLAKRLVFDQADAESSFKTILSQPGMIMGTVSYMSPEQIRGLDVDPRSDIWSLGVVLYEMLFGTTPFGGENSVERLAAILYKEPEKRGGVPVELEKILEKCLQKEPSARYQTAKQLIVDLRHLRQEIEFAEQLQIHATSGGDKEIHETLVQFLSDNPALAIHNTTPTAKNRRSAGWLTFIFAGLLIAILAFLGWEFRKFRQADWASDQLPKIGELARNERYFEAYDLALEVGKYIPESTLENIMPKISDTLSVNSFPAGAKVYLRRFQKQADGSFPERRLVGETPLTDLRVARGNYVLQIEKDGFAPFERTISGSFPRIGGSFIETPPLKIEAKLIEQDKMPLRMVFVPGGEYALVNWSRSTESKVRLDDYFIDKYEVTNAEFKEFITAGGYWKKEFWRVPVVKDGRRISIDEALQLFKDRTGLPAPRSWTNQNFPDGKAEHPVTDITWYEAAAYAEFRGKSLPTIFQWEKAARDGTFDPRFNAMPWGFIRQGETTDNRANFRGTGTVAAAANEFGMSPFGAFNMAGNVSEWNLNQSAEGFITSGGAWNDLAYSFGDHGEYPGLYSENRIGFRCVLNTNNGRDQGAEKIPPAETPEYKPSSDADFRVWLTHYEYDKKPLDAKTIETIETEAWTREKITFAGEGGEQALAYLYLPKNYPRPLQVLHYVPPGDVVRGLRPLPDSVEMFAAPFIKSGRAVFAVVLKGYVQRPFPPNYVPPENSTVEFRKQMVNWITDLRRGVDYLESRDDLARDKIAFLGISNGANLGLVLTAVETRYKTLVFESAGLEKDFRTRIAETSPIKFASQIKTPKLVINGRYDETFPLNTDARPLFKLLREPKKIILYDGGHIPTAEFFVPTVNNWLDETLGAVAK